MSTKKSSAPWASSLNDKASRSASGALRTAYHESANSEQI